MDQIRAPEEGEPESLSFPNEFQLGKQPNDSKLMNDLASEQGRFYWPDGRPAYTIIGKNGKERATHVGDARKLDLRPSVTTISRMLPAPRLEAWKQEQVLMAALTLPIIEGETLEQRAERVRHDSKEQAKKARERGSKLHGAISQAVRGEEFDVAWKPHVEAVKEKFTELDLDFYAGASERSFASDLGYGGCCDWHITISFPVHGDERDIVVDFKNKPFIEPGKRLGFDEHILQLAAYGKGLEMVRPRALSFFVGVEDAKVAVTEWTPEEYEYGWRLFASLFETWKIVKKWT